MSSGTNNKVDAVVLRYSCLSDIQHLLEEVDIKDEAADYYPFPSNMFFLYLLIHSPHPIVGHD